MDAKTHWDKVYGEKTPDAVSWYRPHLDTSLSLIDRAVPDRSSSIIDVGGGESTLVDDLLVRGYQDLTVLDVSQTAIEFTQQRVGAGSSRVRWLIGDVTQIKLPSAAYDLWHDRAVFHFLTTMGQRTAYVRQVLRAVRDKGTVLIGTFGPEGPQKCSGLDVVRYDAESLQGEFGSQFRLLENFTELHKTPFGTTQQFLYCYCQVEKTSAGGT